METFSIPTEAELKDRLGGLERLMKAQKWERAAIVWAFTRSSSGQRTDLHGKSTKFPVTMSEFADLGFAGLRGINTVARYRATWQRAIDLGQAEPVHPGQTEVQYPKLDYPKVPEEVRSMSAVTKAIKNDPQIARAAEKALQEPRDGSPRPQRTRDHLGEFYGALGRVQGTLGQMRGTWKNLTDEQQRDPAIQDAILACQRKLDGFMLLSVPDDLSELVNSHEE